MNFNEMILACEAADNEFDSTFSKCVAFAEASYNEYKTNLKEASLKVAKESGTPDDLIYLEDAASEGFIVRSAKTIEKIFQSFIKWIKDKIEAIKNFFDDKKTKETLEKAEKVIKENPKLKNKTVVVPDYDKQEKAYKKLSDEVNKIKVTTKSGKIKDSDSDDLDKIDDDLDKLNKQKAVITVTIGLGAAAAMVATYVNAVKNKKPDNDAFITQTDLEKMSPEDAEIAVHLVRTSTEIEKAETNALIDALNDTFGAVKTAITGEGKVDPDILSKESTNEVHHSVENKEMDTDIQEAYLNNILDDINHSITENTSNDDFSAIESSEDTYDNAVEAYLESVVEEIFGERKNTKKSAFNAQTVLESLETELFGNNDFSAEEYLESIEAEILNENETVTCENAEVYLNSLETELFSESEDDTAVTDEEYLESLESELFSDDDDEITEKADSRLDAMLDDILNSLE